MRKALVIPLIRSSMPEAHRGLRFDREVRFAKLPPNSQDFLARSPDTFHPTTRAERIGRAATVGKPRATMPWLAAAFALVDQVNQEAEEEGYPPIGELARRNAKRVLFIASRSPLEPEVYASMDGEVAIYFKSRSAPSALLILLDNEGGAGCYWSMGGESEHQRHNDVSQLREDFFLDHLRALGGLPLSQSLV